ncbi:hypothetical protein ADK64_30165 [Streptomyces sp. MMG1121]|nr:hypothetical protein ADK64_30165 [Streptomyces sp. MMG1121]
MEPPLTALLDDAPFLHSLVDALGSPLNVLLPERIAENADRFRAVLRDHRLAGRVYYAHKANRSSALVRRLAAADPAGVGVDVASLGELRHVLGSGVTPDRIMATGPKDPEFLLLAARTGATVNVDSGGELEQLAGMVRKYDLPRTDVLLRLSAFEAAGDSTGAGVRVLSRRSRFGTPVGEAGELLSAVERHRDAVELTGVAYHLDTTALAEKVRALERCVTVMDECRARGLAPRVIDIGGGFGVGYVADAGQWERYTTALTESVLGIRPPLTWRGYGYGLRNEGGTVRGAAALYPAHRPTAGPGYLDELLSQTAPALGRPPATLLLEHLYDLYVEPGRALVDQCGLSLARVLDGAEIEELPGQSECLDPTDTDDPLTRFHQVLSQPGSEYVHTDQYFNPRNTEAHAAGTGPEIVKDLDGRAPDWFIACVGTAGSSTGVARVLREHDPEVQVLGLVAQKSDFIPGIRTIDEVRQVGLFDPATYDTIESVTSEEAIDGMLTLIRRCGLLSGPTGGAAYQGAIRHLRAVDEELPESEPRRTAVFVVCDRAESYLSYVRQRRPELLGSPRRGPSVTALTEADVRAEGKAIGTDDARRWITGGEPPPLVVDLRGPHAYAALHIEGSVNIVDEIFEELVRGGLPFSKRRPVLLSCPVGEKSARYAALLTRMGHPDVRSLAGGIVAWRDAGAPLVRE